MSTSRLSHHSKAEYGQYMSKKTNLRQTHIVTLTDYHRKQIEDIQHDKENMLKGYEQKKQGSAVRTRRPGSHVFRLSFESFGRS